jgi:hypothetical protein
MRQKRCKINGCKNGKAINIIDDCSENKSLYNTAVYQGLYKNGTRHWNGMIITSLQYCVDFPPSIRKCATYVAIGFEGDLKEREKLYENFGGLCGSYKDFCDIMDGIIVTQDEHGKRIEQDETDEFTFMVIKREKPSPNREENVFYIKAKNMKHIKWKFGCKEFWEWDNKRRDPEKVSSYLI